MIRVVAGHPPGKLMEELGHFQQTVFMHNFT